MENDTQQSKNDATASCMICGQSVDAPVSGSFSVHDRVMDVLADMDAELGLHLDLYQNADDNSPDQSDSESDKQKQQQPPCPTDTKLPRDTYWYAMAKESLESKLDWRDPAQRKQAHMNILSLFRRRFRQDKESEETDRVGPALSNGPEIEIRNGRIYFPEYEKFLDDMYEDQRKLRPKKYNPKEHAVVKLLEVAIGNGAQRVSHLSYDDRGIRDLITIEKGETEKWHMIIRNIALAEGHLLTTDEAFLIAEKSENGFIEGRSQDGLFIISDVPIPQEEAHKIISVAENEKSVLLEQRFEKLQDSIKFFTEDQHTFEIPTFLQRLLGLQEDRKIDDAQSFLSEGALRDLLTKKENQEVLTALTTESKVKNGKKEDLVTTWRKIAEKVLHITPEQSQKLLETVQETWEAIQNVREVFAFVQKTGVGTGAAIGLIESLITFNNKILSQFFAEKSAIEASDIIVEKEGKLIMQGAALTKIIDHVVIENTEIETMPWRRVEKNMVDQTEKLKVNEVIVGWVKGFVKELDTKTPQEAIVIVEKEEEYVVKKIIFFREVIEEIVKNHDSAKEEEKPIREVALAVMLWMILQFAAYHQTLRSIKEALMEIHSLKTLSDIGKKEIAHIFKEHILEGLIDHEGTSWLLSAIIWYLAMIREQGIVQTQTTKKPGTKKKKTLFPVSVVSTQMNGVIFTYAS